MVVVVVVVAAAAVVVVVAAVAAAPAMEARMARSKGTAPPPQPAALSALN